MKKIILKFFFYLRKKISYFSWYPRVASLIKHPAYFSVFLGKDTLRSRSFFRKIVSIINYMEYRSRRKLAEKFHIEFEMAVPYRQGYGVIDLGDDPVLLYAVERARSCLGSYNKNSDSKKPFLHTLRFDLKKKDNLPIIDLASHEKILSVVSSYLKTFPILLTAQLWYSPNKDFYEGRSQEYHIDGEDVDQLKCLIPIYDVTSDSGPLTLIPADVSAKVYENLRRQGLTNRRNIKHSDDVIYSESPIKQGIQLVGNVGKVMFVDTCRCYHYGSRPSSNPRILLFLHYVNPFSPMLPSILRKYNSVIASHNHVDESIRRMNLLSLTSRNYDYIRGRVNVF